MRSRPAALVLGASLLMPLAMVGPTSARTSTDPTLGVCSGVDRCHIKAHVDIDGDGDKDAVGVARQRQDGHRYVIVRVKTDAGQITSVRRNLGTWLGTPWQGTAQLDGRPGREIVVGRVMGAHAQLYRSLTWRRGGLRTFDAPGRGGSWMIDSAIWTSMGWKQPPKAPEGTIRHRAAFRVGDNDSPFEGTVITYRWTRAGWDRVGTRTFDRISDAQAARWGGFHVAGLARW